MFETQLTNLKVNIPAEVVPDFYEISAENGMKPEQFASYAIKEYIANSGKLPPPAEVIVEQLRQVQQEFEEEGVIHLSLFGSVARNEAKRGSDIDLLAEFTSLFSMKGWSRAIDIAKRQLGNKFEIDLVPQKFKREGKSNSAYIDAIKIF